jgi:hypothetical protein
MFSNELKSFLIHILTSWQVIVAVVVVILYISLVSYVARFRKRVSGPLPIKALKLKKEKKPAKKTGEDDDEDDEDEDE